MTRSPHIGFLAQGGAGWAGGAEYIRNLARAVRSAATDQSSAGSDATRVSLFCSETAAAEWRTDFPGTVIPISTTPARRFWHRWCPPGNETFFRAVDAAGADFLYPFTYDNRYNLGLRFPLRARATRWAGWIPDFQHRYLPHLFSAKEITRRESGIAALILEAKTIVFSSGSALADYARFYPGAAPRGEVLRFATHPQSDWYEPYVGDLSWVPERFFVVCNQFWKHKNHLTLFEALRILAGRGITPPVLCTGALWDARDPDYTNTILGTIQQTGLHGTVRCLGMVPRRLQIELIRRSLAVVQPSRFEGWSTVLEDARVLGKSCVASGISVHLEQDVPGACYFDVEDPAALAERLAEAWESLAPGPDLARETEARAAAATRIHAVGQRFLEIARY